MFTLNNLALLALAGTSFAAPAPGNWGGWRQGGWNHGDAAPAPSAAAESTSTVWDIQTATVYMTGEAPAWTPAPTSTPEASPAAFYTANGWGSEAPAATPAASSAGWSAPSTGGYMDVVNKWRSAGGLSQLSHDSTLESNAVKTANDGNGQMVHELNPGSMAQVLAPGDDSNFESVYVGGWLCERHDLPGLNGICSSMEQGWDHSNGETGHADILSSGSYSKIGCGLAKGIWACDLA